MAEHPILQLEDVLPIYCRRPYRYSNGARRPCGARRCSAECLVAYQARIAEAVTHGLEQHSPNLRAWFFLTVKFRGLREYQPLVAFRSEFRRVMRGLEVEFFAAVDFSPSGFHLHAIVFRDVVYGHPPVDRTGFIKRVCQDAGQSSGLPPSDVRIGRRFAAGEAPVGREPDEYYRALARAVYYTVGRKKARKMWVVPASLGGKQLVFASRNLFGNDGPPLSEVRRQWARERASVWQESARGGDPPDIARFYRRLREGFARSVQLFR